VVPYGRLLVARVTDITTYRLKKIKKKKKRAEEQFHFYFILSPARSLSEERIKSNQIKTPI